jgi:hypothetical protein
MPVWFAPLVFHGLVTAARAAVPHVARLLTQAATSTAARTAAIGASARAAGPGGAVPFVVGGVAGATAIASGLGLIPPTQSGVIPQSLQKPSQTFPTIDRNVYGTTTVSSGGGSPAQPAPTARAANSTSQSQPAPEPPPPPELGPPPVYAGVKAAPIDTVVFVDEPFDPNYFEDVLFQDFGGQELLTVARNDTVNGQNISYQPFKDLGIIRDQYTPNSLLSIQETSDRFFANFLIRLNEKIPGVGNGPDGATVYPEDEGETGSIVIEFINIESNEQVEIQILNAGIIEDIGI